MIELLILFELNKKVLTMYGISKEIKKDFSSLTTPSFGTIKPALKRLESADFIKSQKTMSSGGRPSTYYSLSKGGFDELKRLILETPLENPIQFLPASRIKLACTEILNNQEKKELFKGLKFKAENITYDIKAKLESNDLDFYPKMVFDNLFCEYKNFITLLEGFERVSKN